MRGSGNAGKREHSMSRAANPAGSANSENEPAAGTPNGADGVPDVQ
jgi:hypothetical protein